MFLNWLLAFLHLLALGIGLGAVWGRRRALREAPGPEMLRRVFYADHLWAMAGVLWLVTGLVRAFGPLEKGAAWYLAQPFFHAKLGLFVVILALEAAPLAGLIRWRIQARRGLPVDMAKARLFAAISTIQGALVVVMVGLAVAIARGMRP